MANRSQVQGAFASAFGLNPMTLDNSFRHLATHGMLPATPRGKRSPDFIAEHLKNITLSLAAFMPSDAAETVAKLDALVFNFQRSSTNARPRRQLARRGVTTLGQVIVADLSDVTADQDGLTRLREIAGTHPRSTQLILSIEPAFAEFRQAENPAPGSGAIVSAYGSMETTTAPAAVGTRLFVCDYDRLLLLAAELLLDTDGRKAGLPFPDLAPGSADEGDAISENEKAPGTGIHEGLSDYPAPKARLASFDPTKIEASLPEQEGSKQLRPTLSGLGSRVRAHRSATRRAKPASRSNEHGSHRTDAAPPPPG